MFLGMFLGSITYLIFLSSYVIKINVKIITYVKIVLQKCFGVLTFPFALFNKFIKKVFVKPIYILIINIRKIYTRLPSKRVFISKKIKKNVK